MCYCFPNEVASQVEANGQKHMHVWQHGEITAPSSGRAWQLQLIEGVLVVPSKCWTFPQWISDNTASLQTVVLFKCSLSAIS